jgi:hypothetical protein
MSNSNIVLQKSVGDLPYRNLSFFAPCLALGIRGAKAHCDQIANRLGTRGVAWLQVAPLINRLLPDRVKSQTDD